MTQQFLTSLVITVITILLSACGGGGDTDSYDFYQGNYKDAGEYTLGYTESTLQIAQESADIIELFGVYPGLRLAIDCQYRGSISGDLSDNDDDGKVSQGDEISISYDDCYREAPNEYLSGNLNINVTESSEDTYQFTVSLTPISFAGDSVGLIEMSGSLLVLYRNDDSVHNLSVSPNTTPLRINFVDTEVSVQETFSEFRLAKTIDHRTNLIDVYAEGQINSPIFSAPITFKTLTTMSASIDELPNNLHIEYASKDHFQGTVTTDGTNAIYSKINGQGQISTQEKSYWKNAIEGFLWNDHAGRYGYPAQSLDPEQSRGQWHEAQLVEYEDELRSNSPEIVFGKGNQIIATWTQWDGSDLSIVSSTNNDGEGWESGQFIENQNGVRTSRPILTYMGEGKTIALFTQKDDEQYDLWMITHINGQGWQSAQLIQNNARDFAIGHDGNGNALLIWTRWDDNGYKIGAKRYIKDSGWHEEAVIASEPDRAGFAPKISMNSAGDALLVWTRGRKNFSEEGYFSLMGMHFTAHTGWGTPTILTDNEDSNALDHSVTLNNKGDGVVVWKQHATTESEFTSALSNRFDRISGWQGVMLLENDEVGHASAPYLTLNHKDQPTAIWSQAVLYEFSKRIQVFISTLTSDEGWSIPERINDNPWKSPVNPTVAYDAKGMAFAVWYQRGQWTGWDLRYSRYYKGEWSDSEMIAEDVDLGEPRIKVSKYGNAVITWVKQEGTPETRHVYSRIFK